MKLPIDTSAMTFLCAVAPEPVRDFDTKRPKADENGEPIYSVQLVALVDDGAELLTVKVAGLPKGLSQGTAVKVSGLVASPWSMGERSGISFRANRIEPVAPATGGRAAS